MQMTFAQSLMVAPIAMGVATVAGIALSIKSSELVPAILLTAVLLLNFAVMADCYNELLGARL